jgi:phenylalanyl-tRNA synthetase alpha chain
LEFAQAFFGEQTQIRLRPSYFPFTEPSAEVDIWWGLENEVDYRMTKGTGWLEIMGCGMVDPAVLAASGIDPEVYSGFAFGMGIERIAMQRFQIPDIRAFYENDSRFLRAFQGAL